MESRAQGKSPQQEEIFYSDDEIETLCAEAEKTDRYLNKSLQWPCRSHSHHYEGIDEVSDSPHPTVIDFRRTPGGDLTDKNQVSLFRPILECWRSEQSSEYKNPKVGKNQSEIKPAALIRRSQPIDIPGRVDRDEINICQDSPHQQVMKAINVIKSMISTLRSTNNRHEMNKEDKDKLNTKIKDLQEENKYLMTKVTNLYERFNMAREEFYDQVRTNADLKISIESKNLEIQRQRQEIVSLKDEIRKIYQQYSNYHRVLRLGK